MIFQWILLALFRRERILSMPERGSLPLRICRYFARHFDNLAESQCYGDDINSFNRKKYFYFLSYHPFIHDDRSIIPLPGKLFSFLKKSNIHGRLSISIGHILKKYIKYYLFLSMYRNYILFITDFKSYTETDMLFNTDHI